MWREVTVLRLHLGRCDVELHNADTCRSPPPVCLPLLASARPHALRLAAVSPRRNSLPLGRRHRRFRYAKITCRDLRPGAASGHVWLPMLPLAAGVRTRKEPVVERPFLLSSQSGRPAGSAVGCGSAGGAGLCARGCSGSAAHAVCGCASRSLPTRRGLSAGCGLPASGLSTGSAVLSAGSAVLSANAGHLRSARVELLRADVLPVVERAGAMHSRSASVDRHLLFFRVRTSG